MDVHTYIHTLPWVDTMQGGNDGGRDYGFVCLVYKDDGEVHSIDIGVGVAYCYS